LIRCHTKKKGNKATRENKKGIQSRNQRGGVAETTALVAKTNQKDAGSGGKGISNH